MWKGYFCKRFRKAKKKLDSRNTKIFTWAIGVILFFDKCSFYLEICLEKIEGEKMNTMQRQNHKSFRISESWAEMLTKYILKKNLPQQGQEGNRCCRLRILLPGQKWGKYKPSFIFRPFPAFILIVRVNDKCLALKLDICLKKIGALWRMGFSCLLQICCNHNLLLPLLKSSPVNRSLSDAWQVLKFSDMKSKASLVGSLKWPLQCLWLLSSWIRWQSWAAAH